jgi:1,4-alpha-glucan branching enzyme
MTSVQDNGAVEFRFYRPRAGSVHVAGDFNGWQCKGLPMRPAGNGWWTATASIPPGEYRFRYVADGNWYTDYAANGVELSRLGWNSILTVAGSPHADHA